ncbi:hypothetical protein BN1051_01491 [Arthrobacter saudimassiliensis]|uniref:DUF3054 domain-containing protein n=1 Tax=Arthrobacter saudimassiliensis TaxID=1461584 RepID=A0A078MLK5_9MICC|nr:hypothetical protein BN1051_01491 [Arthrobacter saudimassiliensis]
MTSPLPDRGARYWPAAAAADAALILLFAGLGRDAHARGLDVGGLLGTAWPFLAAAAVAWAALRLRRRPLRLWPQAVALWLVTSLLGMGLRWLSGGGTALSFQLVTLAVLGAFLLGWRLLAAAVIRGRARRGSDRLSGRTSARSSSKGTP